MTDELVKVLKHQIQKRNKGYVFLSNKKGRYSIRSIIRIVNQYARKSKFISKTIGSHALRRTYASFLLNQGIGIDKISKLLGHASIRTTLTYLYEIINLEDYEEIRKVIIKMNNF